MTNKDLKVARKMVQLAQSSKARGISFNLTFVGLRNVMSAKKCYFSGVPLTAGTLTIDRVDNTKGYITGNVVACHELVNKRKRDLTPDEIELLYKGLQRHKKRAKKSA